NVIVLWEADTGRKIPLRSGSALEFLMGLAWHPEGAHLAATGDDLRVLDRDGRDVWQAQLDPACTSHSLAWSPDGDQLAAAVDDPHAVQIFDGRSGTLRRRLEGYGSDIRFLSWSADGAVTAHRSDHHGTSL